MFSALFSRPSQPPPAPAAQQMEDSSAALVARVDQLDQNIQGLRTDLELLRAQRLDPQSSRLIRSCCSTVTLSTATTLTYWERAVRSWALGGPYVATAGCGLNVLGNYNFYSGQRGRCNLDMMCCGTVETMKVALDSIICMSLRAVGHTATGGCCCNCCGQYNPLNLSQQKT